MAHSPLVLVILDGWGYREQTEYNGVAQAKTPHFNRFIANYPHSTLTTFGMQVGLPEGQMGNSEVGHTNIGAGRVVYQEFTRVTKSIADGDFFTNQVFCNAIDQAKAAGGAVHIMGLLSPGGVHSHEDHLFAAIELAAKRGVSKIYLHAFLDGRDVAPRSALPSLQKADALFSKLGVGRTASVIGRYYAMDRDNRWERVQQAYDLLTQGKAEFHAANAEAALNDAYARDENDEFVKATVVGEPVQMQDGDSILFMNFRSDRARQITYPFTEDDFDGFQRAVRPTLSAYVCLTQYKDSIHAAIAYPPTQLNMGFGETLATHHKKQLRLAETEKYPHVSFFFNGGREQVFEGEDRILVNSPKVATYDLQPEMSAVEVTDRLVEAIESQKYDAIICNFANPDMVGHTGVLAAVVKACETVDQALGRVYDALQKVGGEMLIIADHGNAEMLFDEKTQQPHTAHTVNPVPIIYVGRKANITSGALCDIAPTMLALMDIPQPPQMTGKSLVTLEK